MSGRLKNLPRELARRLRGMNSRQELTDYAVAMLRESAEEANQEEQARESVERAAKVGNINTIAFGLPLGVIGAVLCATGILAGPGMIILGAAAAMVLYGMATAFFIRPRKNPVDQAGQVKLRLFDNYRKISKAPSRLRHFRLLGPTQKRLFWC